MKPPNGIEEITSVFGDVHQYVTPTGLLSPSWESFFLGTAVLPFSIPLSWNKAVTVTRITCHRLLVEVFESVFQSIVQLRLQHLVTSFGGCFSFRPQRGSAKLSTHVWGIAVDINTAENEQGTVGTIDTEIVGAFKSAGFTWGGDWPMPRTDGMHFQFASGY